MLISLYSSCAVIRASVPKMLLDDVFEQKNEIAKAVESELEKVLVHHVSGISYMLSKIMVLLFSLLSNFFFQISSERYRNTIKH